MVAILTMIFVLGIIECCIGCQASVSVYRMLICCFSSVSPEVRRIYNFPFRISATQYVYFLIDLYTSNRECLACPSSFDIVLYLEARNVPTSAHCHAFLT